MWNLLPFDAPAVASHAQMQKQKRATLPNVTLQSLSRVDWKNIINDSEKTEMDLTVLCYRTAYFVLPNFLFSQIERTIGYFVNNEYPEGPYLYMMATQMLKAKPVREHALSFEAFSGELSLGRNYHILQYPVPPDFDLAQKGAMLAPFFSAIIQNTTNAEVSYYVLGQNPMSGTTFRTVTPNGVNANMGPGPLPKRDAFVDFLKRKV